MVQNPFLACGSACPPVRPCTPASSIPAGTASETLYEQDQVLHQAFRQYEDLRTENSLE